MADRDKARLSALRLARAQAGRQQSNGKMEILLDISTHPTGRIPARLSFRPRADNVALSPLLVKPEVEPDGNSVCTAGPYHRQTRGGYVGIRVRRGGPRRRQEGRTSLQEVQLKHCCRGSQLLMLQTPKILRKKNRRSTSLVVGRWESVFQIWQQHAVGTGAKLWRACPRHDHHSLTQEHATSIWREIRFVAVLPPHPARTSQVYGSSFVGRTVNVDSPAGLPARSLERLLTSSDSRTAA